MASSNEEAFKRLRHSLSRSSLTSTPLITRRQHANSGRAQQNQQAQMFPCHRHCSNSFVGAEHSKPPRAADRRRCRRWRFRFFVSLVPVRDLLLFAKHLFIAAMAAIVLAEPQRGAMKAYRRADLAWSADARPVRMGGGAGGGPPGSTQRGLFAAGLDP